MNQAWESDNLRFVKRSDGEKAGKMICTLFAVSPNLATNKNVKLTFSFLEQNLQKKIKYHFRKCQEIASSRKCVFLFKNSQSPGETKS